MRILFLIKSLHKHSDSLKATPTWRQIFFFTRYFPLYSFCPNEGVWQNRSIHKMQLWTPTMSNRITGWKLMADHISEKMFWVCFPENKLRWARTSRAKQNVLKGLFFGKCLNTTLSSCGLKTPAVVRIKRPSWPENSAVPSTKPSQPNTRGFAVPGVATHLACLQRRRWSPSAASPCRTAATPRPRRTRPGSPWRSCWTGGGRASGRPRWSGARV